MLVAYLWFSREIWRSIFLGQVLSILLCATAVISQLLNTEYRVAAPTGIILYSFNYSFNSKLMPLLAFFSSKLSQLCSSLPCVHNYPSLQTRGRRAFISVEKERVEILLHCNSRCWGKLLSCASISVYNTDQCTTSGLLHNPCGPIAQLGNPQSQISNYSHCWSIHLFDGHRLLGLGWCGRKQWTSEEQITGWGST